MEQQQQVIKGENSQPGIHVPQRIIDLQHAPAVGIEVPLSSSKY